MSSWHSAPQAALSVEGKDKFWDLLQDILTGVPPGEFIFLGDLNIGSSSDGYGGYGFAKGMRKEK
jgi:hypothetical protein